MRERICRFVSSSSLLVAAVVAAIGLVQPFEWWLKLLGVAISVPLIVVATNRFFGVHQLFDLGCVRRDKGDARGSDEI